jgi:aryl-alcohol dehydrogenase-like predicted oxidoreductase
MNFGARTKEPEARATTERFAERMPSESPCELDTANLYAQGESERVVGRIVKSAPGRFIVATKVGLDRPGGKPEGLSRESVRTNVSRSLERLGLDRVDTLYVHAPDRETPVEETVAVLKELHAEGLFARWGVSNFASWRALEMMTAARSVGLLPPTRSQIVDNVLARGVETEHLEFASAHALETVAFNPLAGGLLAGTVKEGEKPKEGRFHKNALYTGRYLRDAAFDACARYTELATAHGTTLLALAYRFVVHHRGHGSVLLGPSKLSHVDAAFDAAREPLEPELLKAVNALASALLPANAPYAR